MNTGLRSAVCAAAVTLAATVWVGQLTGIVASPAPVEAPRPTASVRPHQFEHYVALGDSYTSGPLIQRMRADPLGCGRSTNNYPALLARRIKVRTVTDVSCGGAGTEQMTHPQRTVSGTNPPQFDALSSSTDLVTIGIGGNDEGAIPSLLQVCQRVRDSDPSGAPCAKYFTRGGTDDIKRRIDNTRERVAAVLRGIAERAPMARILVVGYPRMVPETGTCKNILPFASGDYRYIDATLLALNTALSSAAAEERATYVNVYTPSRGHDACAGEAAAWINGKDTKPFAALSFHPLAAAMSAEATILDRALRAGQRPAGSLREPAAPMASYEQTRAIAGRFTRAVPTSASPRPSG